MAARRKRSATVTTPALRKLIESSPEVFREVLDTAAQGIIAVDGSGRIVMVNDAASTMFGYTRTGLVDLPLSSLIPLGTRRAHARHVRAFFRDPERRPMGQGMDLEGMKKDGTRFPIEVALSAVEVRDVPIAVAFVSDITRRKAIEEEVARYRDQLSQLTAHIVSVSEDAGRAWARELHDVYSQRLAALSMRLSHLPVAWEAHVGPIESEARRLAEDIHALSRRMHPGILHDLGLVAALRAELASFGRETGMRTMFTPDGSVAGMAGRIPNPIPDDVALCLYRIVQESLRNVRKHSGAGQVEVRLGLTRKEIALEVKDDGRGFDPREAAGRGGLGLISMAERTRAVGGGFRIESTPGGGTVVGVRVPR